MSFGMAKDRLFILRETKILEYWECNKVQVPKVKKGEVNIRDAKFEIDSKDDNTIVVSFDAVASNAAGDDAENSIICKAKTKVEADEW